MTSVLPGLRDFGTAVAGTRPTGGLPRWTVPASLGLGLTGLGLSIYLTVEHFTGPGTLFCPVGGAVSCTQVTTSAQSKFLGIPVALLGVIFFAAMVALCLPQVWQSRDPRVAKARMGVAGLGLLFVIYLIFSEIFIIEAYCLWCTAVHLVTFALYSVVIMGTARADPSPLDAGR